MEYLSTTAMAGDYLEFGVYRGWSFVAAYKLAELHGLDQMKFYAFDSFQGLPELDDEDQTTYPQYTRGDYACDETEFRRNLKRHGVNDERVHIIAGWYDETLTESTRVDLGLDRVSVAWIDCDLYTSTKLVLQFLTDLIQPGSIIVFDDWLAFRGNPARGEQGAFRKWLESNPQFQAVHFGKMGWHGNVFIIQKA